MVPGPNKSAFNTRPIRGNAAAAMLQHVQRYDGWHRLRQPDLHTLRAITCLRVRGLLGCSRLLNGDMDICAI